MSAPPALPPPPDGDVNRGPALIALFWVEIIVSIIFVSLRFYVRRVMRNIGWDDWTILITLILFVITLSISTVLVHHGLGRHFYYVPIESRLEVARINWIVQPFGIMALPFGKISVAILLLRLMPPNVFWRKWILWLNMILFTVVMILASILSYVQCDPPRALWEFVPEARCWDPSIQANWALAGSVYSAFLDFFLALLPITIIWGLRLNLKRKIGLGLLLGAGVFSGICASIKSSHSRSLGVRSDITWVLFELYAWSASEVFINIVCACIPTLNPLWDRLTKGTTISSHSKPKPYYASSKSDPPSLGSSSDRDNTLSFQNAKGNETKVGLSYSKTNAKDNTISIDHSYRVDVESVG